VHITLPADAANMASIIELELWAASNLESSCLVVLLSAESAAAAAELKVRLVQQHVLAHVHASGRSCA